MLNYSIFKSLVAVCALLYTVRYNAAILPTAFLNEMHVNALKSIFIQKLGDENGKLQVYLQYETKENQYVLDDIASRLMRELKGTVFLVNLGKTVLPRNFDHYDLILVDTLKSFRFLYQYSYDINSRTLASVVVYISTINDTEHADIEEAFRLLWKLSILNVIIVLELSKNNLTMLTYFPYGITGCHITKSVIINRYNEHKLEWEHKNYFPEKLKNFYGCKWMWATQEDMPYLAFERDVHKNIVSYKGFEGQLLNFMSRNLNFSIEVQEVDFNEVLDGAKYAEMVLQYPEYVLGGLHYIADLWGNATFSQSFNFFLSHFFVVTNLPSFDSSIEKLLFSFQTSAWLLIGTCYIFASIFIFIYGNLNAKWREVVMGHRNTAPHYNLFVIAMGSSSVAAVPRRNFARFLLIIWLLATLVLRSVYQARMYQMLRDKTFHNPPKTIVDALSGDYVLQTIPSTNAVFRSLPIPKQQVFLNETEKNILIAMGYSEEPKALVTAYEYYGYIRKMNLINHRLHLVKQRILTKQLVYFVRKNSHLLFEINMQILTAQTYGFMDKWIREIVQYDHILGSPKTSASKENAKNFVIERTANVLSLQELEAVFIALVLLHGCSIVVFILEIYLFRN